MTPNNKLHINVNRKQTVNFHKFITGLKFGEERQKKHAAKGLMSPANENEYLERSYATGLTAGIA